jgi:hypothetical protein
VIKRKVITADNVFTIDEPESLAGGSLPWNIPADIISHINAPTNQLIAEVPDEIAGLVEAAKIAFAYSLSYSPLRAAAWHYFERVSSSGRT